MMKLNYLQNRYSKPGVIKRVGIRPLRMDPVQAITQVKAVKGKGLGGDCKNIGGNLH